MALQQHQPFVAHLAAQAAVFDRFPQAFFEGRDKDLPALVFQKTAVRLLLEVGSFQFLPVEQFEQGAIYQNRFEDLRQVEREAVAAGAGLVQEADGGIELGVVDHIQGQGVTHHVAEGNGGVDLIGRRLFAAAVHREIHDDLFKGLVVGLPAVAFDAHQLRHTFYFRHTFAEALYLADQLLDMAPPAVVIAQVFEHVETGAAHQRPGDVQAALAAQVGAGLFNLHLAGQQVFFGLEGAGVVFVVVEEMNRDALLAQEVEQGAVGVDAAEDVQGFDAFDGQVAGLLLVAHVVDGGELEGVVAARHAAGVEEVVGLFHGQDIRIA